MVYVFPATVISKLSPALIFKLPLLGKIEEPSALFTCIVFTPLSLTTVEEFLLKFITFSVPVIPIVFLPEPV